MSVPRKIKDSIIYEEPIETTAFEVGSSPASDLELARAALDAAVDAGTASVLEAGVDNFSCCAKCGGFDYVEPSPEDHAARYVRVQTPEQLARSKRGTCADLAIYNACIINAKRIAKGKERMATAEIIPNARGPGKHHVVTVDDLGRVGDPAEAVKAGGKCKLCS